MPSASQVLEQSVVVFSRNYLPPSQINVITLSWKLDAAIQEAESTNASNRRFWGKFLAL